MTDKMVARTQKAEVMNELASRIHNVAATTREEILCPTNAQAAPANEAAIGTQRKLIPAMAGCRNQPQ